MHETVRNVRIDGKGQATPGPSLSVRLRAAAGPAALSAIAWIALALASAGRFVFETSTIGHQDGRAVAGAGAIIAGVLAGWVFLPRASSVERRRGLSATVLVTAGVAALVSGGVPVMVFANRYSDAPKGSIVLFWTVVVAGVALWLMGALEGAGRAARSSGSVLAMAGAMGVLANWERPSSFSLLSRYANEQVAMGIASLVWAAGVFWVVQRARRDGWKHVAAPFAIGATLVGALLIASSPSPGDALAPAAILAAACGGLAVFLALWLGVERGVALPATALVAVPVVVSSMTLIESALGMRGPRPLLLAEVVWAGVVCAAGLVIGWMGSSRPIEESLLRSARPTGAIWLGVSAVALAAIGFAAPGVAVAIRGVREIGAFSADLTMSGAETVGGWIVLGMSLVVLASLWRFSRAGALRALFALPLAFGGWTVLRFIPLHTWISWIPAEVQQEYGTEYASIVFSPVSLWWQGAALVACALGAVVLVWNLYGAIGSRVGPSDSKGAAHEEV